MQLLPSHTTASLSHTQDTRDDSPAQTLVGSTPYIAPEMMFPPYDALVCHPPYHALYKRPRMYPPSHTRTRSYTLPPTYTLVPTVTHTPSQKADLWCAGVFLFWMVCGQPPFGEIPNHARIGAVRYPPNVAVTSELDDLLKRLLVKEPEERLTLEQLKQHPWFVRGLPPRAFDSNVPSRPIPPEVCVWGGGGVGVCMLMNALI